MVILGSRRVAAVGGVSALVVAGVALGIAPVGATPGHRAAPSAKIISSGINGVSVAPKSTVTWVLGSEQTATASHYFAAKRTGSHFAKVKVAKVGTYESFAGITAASPKSIFLVGSGGGKNGSFVLIEHSKGGAFKRMTVPKGVVAINSISASSATNVWTNVGVEKKVAGSIVDSNELMHWNGHAWRLIPLSKAVLAKGTPFGPITTSGPTNTWFLLSTATTPEAVRYTGHKFLMTPLKVPTGGGVASIAAGSTKNVWAYGSAARKSGAGYTFSLHFTGKSWHSVIVPQVGYTTEASSLAVSGSHAYLVGSYYPKKSPKAGQAEYAFALTYKGGKWRSVSHAKRGVTSGLGAVSASSKVAVASGVAYNGYLCGAKRVVGTGYILTIHSSSGSTAPSPKLRTLGGLSPALAFAPNRPAC